jgi:hypothetical protein
VKGSGPKEAREGIPWDELWPVIAMLAIAAVGLLVDRWRTW